jgi:maltose/moltooligosaccharide transporter
MPKDDKPFPVRKYWRRGIIWSLVGLVFAWPVYQYELEKELYILAGGLATFGILQLASAALIAGKKRRTDWSASSPTSTICR